MRLTQAISDRLTLSIEKRAKMPTSEIIFLSSVSIAAFNLSL
ncbi:MAG: hypothetical protein V7K30_02195 [Nostoc sp.]